MALSSLLRSLHKTINTSFILVRFPILTILTFAITRTFDPVIETFAILLQAIRLFTIAGPFQVLRIEIASILLFDFTLILASGALA